MLTVGSEAGIGRTRLLAGDVLSLMGVSSRTPLAAEVIRQPGRG